MKIIEKILQIHKNAEKMSKMQKNLKSIGQGEKYRIGKKSIGQKKKYRIGKKVQDRKKVG